jgi:hypothetical protein
MSDDQLRIFASCQEPARVSRPIRVATLVNHQLHDWLQTCQNALEWTVTTSICARVPPSMDFNIVTTTALDRACIMCFVFDITTSVRMPTCYSGSISDPRPDTPTVFRSGSLYATWTPESQSNRTEPNGPKANANDAGILTCQLRT